MSLLVRKFQAKFCHLPIRIRLGNIDEGYRMSEICYGIYEMVDAKVWLCRISAVNFYFIHGWVRPLSECLEPLNHAFQVGLETGDIEFALSCKLVQSFTRNEMGRLPELFDNVRDLRELMITYGQSASVIITASQYQLMRNLMEVGKSEPWNMMGEFIDETTLLAIQSIKMVNAWNQMHRALLSFLFGRFPEAAEYAKNCRELAMRSSGPLAGGQVLFYCGLVDVANARLQKKFRAPFARQCSNALWRSSVNGGILNFIGKHYILEAELAALSGRTADALRLYVTAISTSKNGKLIFQTALANERTARFIWEAKDYSLAKEFFIEALVWYKEYGAGAKVAHLEDEIRRLY